MPDRLRTLLVLLLTAVMAAAPTPASPSDAGYAVVGGQPAAEGAWPSVVALLRAEDPDDVTAQLCAGTAIAPDLVLTAAHCVHSATGDVTRGPDQLRVAAGRTDLSADGGVERLGTEIYVHPSYDARRKRHDVAVVRVDGDLGVPLQPLVAPDAPGPAPGSTPTVVGWGRTGTGDAAASRTVEALVQADVLVPEADACAAAYGGALDPAIHLCAGGAGTDAAPAADACTGDSGGPLLLAGADGVVRQVGITSFGPSPCGVGEPGVYVHLAGVRDFVDAVLAGAVAPAILPGIEAPAGRDGQAIRVADPSADATAPIAQAVAASRAVFDAGRAELAVLARADGYADALAGSALGYGRGPLLLTPADGPLAPETREELVRALQPGSVVYLLGGPAAVPESAAHELRDLGFLPQRLWGSSREATAAAVGEEVVRRHGGGVLPDGTAILVTAGAWPDAVVAGQLGAWWGYPILLTPADGLHPDTAASLSALAPRRLLVVGGQGAVPDAVVAQATALLPELVVQRLAGDTRIETGLTVARWHVDALAAAGEPPPDAVLAVNLRREDGYAHVLSATPLLGATAGVLLPVEGEGGDLLTSQAVESFCGLGGLPLVVGGVDVVAEDVAGRLAGILDGSAC